MESNSSDLSERCTHLVADRWCGILLIASFLVHLTNCFWHGHWYDAMWACHVAALTLGLGLLMVNATLIGIGALCLVVGTPLWLVDVATGAELVPTSALTHLLGWIVSVFVLVRGQAISGMWWKTLLALGLLQYVSRWVTPPHRNVNAAFEVYASVAPWFPSYVYYWISLVLAAALIFWVIDRVVSRVDQVGRRSSATNVR